MIVMGDSCPFVSRDFNSSKGESQLIGLSRVKICRNKVRAFQKIGESGKQKRKTDT